MTVVDFELARRRRLAQAIRDDVRAIRAHRPLLIERILEGDAMRRVSQAMADALNVSTRAEKAQPVGGSGQSDRRMPFSRREGGTL